MALTRQGMDAVDISEQTGIPYRTVARWRAKWQNMSPINDPELASQDYRLAMRQGFLLEDWTDRVEDAAPHLSLKEWNEVVPKLYTSRGIAIDKITRRREAGNQNVQFNIILEQRERLRRQLDVPTFDGVAPTTVTEEPDTTPSDAD